MTEGKRTSTHPALLDRLNNVDCERLIAAGVRRKFDKDQMLFCQNEAMNELYVILKGRVRVFYLSEVGNSLTFAYWTEGTLVGTPAVWSGFVHQWSATAAEKTEVLAVNRERFNALLKTSSALSMAVIEALEFKAKRLGNICQILATNSVAERLKLLIENLAELYGESTGARGYKFESPFTQEDLAEMVGASRPWISSLLAEMKRRGIIEYNQRKFFVKNIEELRAAKF